MPAEPAPHVLIIDDEPDAQRSTAGVWDLASTVSVFHPQDLTHSELNKADLVLVDYRLERWPERDSLEAIGLKPLNGLSLSAILRVYAEQHGDTPTAFALRSGHLKDISGQFPPEPRVHVLAKRLNLEWVFAKSSAAEPQQIDALAMAVRQLPTVWPADNTEQGRNLIERFLSIPDERWAGQAWQAIASCQPPIHEPFLKPPHSLAFLRWLLQSILPYPSLLLDTHWLAARLRVTHNSLITSLQSGLRNTFHPFIYKGALSEFLGPRWWRAGLEVFLWNLTDGKSFDQELVYRTLTSLPNVTLTRTPTPNPVVCIDADYKPLEESVDIDDAVRIRPDDWPPYADQAWTTKSVMLDNPRLAALALE